jgi:hypothetical protein
MDDHIFSGQFQVISVTQIIATYNMKQARPEKLATISATLGVARMAE